MPEVSSQREIFIETNQKLSRKLFHLFFGLENMVDKESDTAQLQRFPAFWMKNSDVF